MCLLKYFTMKFVHYKLVKQFPNCERHVIVQPAFRTHRTVQNKFHQYYISYYIQVFKYSTHIRLEVK